MDLQPTPLSGMQLISEEPIRLVEQRIASCDGGVLLALQCAMRGKQALIGPHCIQAAAPLDIPKSSST